MYGRYKPPKMTEEEQKKHSEELQRAKITRKERWAMTRSAMLVIMPAVIGVMCIFLLVAWLFVRG